MLAAGTRGESAEDWPRLGQPSRLESRQPFPERCQALANLCTPYIASGIAPANLIPRVNRKTYPEPPTPRANGSTNFSTKSTRPRPRHLRGRR